MKDNSHIIAIAVDGGGTQCRLAAVTETDYQVVVSEASNASTDMPATIRSISNGLAALSDKTNLSVHQLTEKPAYLGIAGVVGQHIANELHANLPFEHALVEEDRRAALRGALGSKNGYLAHCGTGSFFAKQLNDKQRIVGGWGPVLGDEASAYWVAKQTLAVTLNANDGLVPESEMTKAIQKQIGNPSALVAYARDSSVTSMAAVAKIVTQYAEQQDVHAVSILTKSANLIHAQLIQLGWESGDNVCLTGGIASHYRAYLASDISAVLIEPLGEPIDGAVALAREFANTCK